MHFDVAQDVNGKICLDETMRDWEFSAGTDLNPFWHCITPFGNALVRDHIFECKIADTFNVVIDSTTLDCAFTLDQETVAYGQWSQG